jgi:hypothetical protein
MPREPSASSDARCSQEREASDVPVVAMVVCRSPAHGLPTLPAQIEGPGEGEWGFHPSWKAGAQTQPALSSAELCPGSARSSARHQNTLLQAVLIVVPLL